jgi:AraC-like DNA-binding protein
MNKRLPRNAIPTPLDEIRLRIFNCQAIRLSEPTKWWHSDNYAVPYWRLYWNKTAGAALIFDSRRVELLPDQIFLVIPNTITAKRCRHPLDHYFVHFVADPPYDRVRPGIISFPATPELTNTLRQLSDLVAVEPHRKKLLSVRILFLCYFALSKVPEELIHAGYRDQRALRAIACMDHNMAHPVGNAELAQTAGMHPTAFIRMFKKQIGMSPQSFYQIRRIEEACRLLHSTDHKLDDIATATGFYDRFHFSRVFKKIRGITPAQFRRKR